MAVGLVPRLSLTWLFLTHRSLQGPVGRGLLQSHLPRRLGARESAEGYVCIWCLKAGGSRQGHAMRHAIDLSPCTVCPHPVKHAPDPMDMSNGHTSGTCGLNATRNWKQGAVSQDYFWAEELLWPAMGCDLIAATWHECPTA